VPVVLYRRITPCETKKRGGGSSTRTAPRQKGIELSVLGGKREWGSSGASGERKRFINVNYFNTKTSGKHPGSAHGQSNLGGPSFHGCKNNRGGLI